MGGLATHVSKGKLHFSKIGKKMLSKTKDATEIWMRLEVELRALDKEMENMSSEVISFMRGKEIITKELFKTTLKYGNFTKNVLKAFDKGSTLYSLFKHLNDIWTKLATTPALSTELQREHLDEIGKTIAVIREKIEEAIRISNIIAEYEVGVRKELAVEHRLV